MQFEFTAPNRLIFGSGAASQLPQLASAYGSRILLLTGSHLGPSHPLISSLQAAGLELLHEVVRREPQLEDITLLKRQIAAFHPDAVLSIGGGSVLDSGKAAAALYSNPGDVLDYLEVIGRGEPLTADPLPHIAVPTTAGTGSEVTRNAVISVPGLQVKVSLRNPRMVPPIAVVDPELTLGLNARMTVATGMDALTQVVEPLLSRRSNPLCDALCEKAIPMAVRALPVALDHPNDPAAREELSLVSLFSGLALANSGLGVVHAFAAAIGGLYPGTHHGEICAALLAAGVQANREAALGDPVVTERFERLSRLLSAGGSQTPDQVLFSLAASLGVRRLGELGVRRDEFDVICSRTLAASSMKANPVELSSDDLKRILATSF